MGRKASMRSRRTVEGSEMLIAFETSRPTPTAQTAAGVGHSVRELVPHDLVALFEHPDLEGEERANHGGVIVGTRHEHLVPAVAPARRRHGLFELEVRGERLEPG